MKTLDVQISMDTTRIREARSAVTRALAEVQRALDELNAAYRSALKDVRITR